MAFKMILYIIVLPVSLWAIESLKIEHLFKKNRIYQIQAFYLLIAISITYLVVNFFTDFFSYSKFI